jgi:environmental stress-induced protein Ves
MSSKIIRPQDWQRQIWKNGQGMTNQLLIEEDALGIIWRVSIAEVKQDGPFSIFAGFERVIALLDGDGFTMNFDGGGSHTLNSRFQDFRFAGDSQIHCQLLGNSSRDFNLMTRRDKVNARFRTIQLAAGEAYQQQFSSRCVVFVAAGASIISFAEQNHQLVSENGLVV